MLVSSSSSSSPAQAWRAKAHIGQFECSAQHLNRRMLIILSPKCCSKFGKSGERLRTSIHMKFSKKVSITCASSGDGAVQGDRGDR